jgi:uncharacterized damage-inducible protein DinB
MTPRVEPPQQADELTTLLAYLDYHRRTLVEKVSGLTAEQLARTLPPSSLTLGGLVKHLALVEDNWFVERMAGRPAPEPWARAPFDDDPDWDFHSAGGHTPAELVALYDDACARSRAVVAELGSPEARSARVRPLTGEPFTLRWLLLHMIEETARHNGHADLLREAIDGATGQ